MWQRLQAHRGALFFVLVLAVVAGLILFQLRAAPGRKPVLDSLTPAPVPTPTPSPTPGPLRVYVSGAVVQPDVYRLPPGSIVKDALLAAGGAAADADLERINLAAPLSDGEQVHVPRVGQEALPVQAPSRAGDTRVDVNRAGVEELDTLPGIGPVLAERIVEYRQAHGPFQKVEDLLEVQGIGPAVLEKIRELVRVD